MQLIELKHKNMFNPKDFVGDSAVVYAQCLSSDFDMSGGISLEYAKNFGIKSKLFTWADEHKISTEFTEEMKNPIRPELVGQAIKIENVYNLITKTQVEENPKFFDFESCIRDLKRSMIFNKDKILVIPDLIGCGYDKLDRGYVIGNLRAVFLYTDILIYVVSK